MILKNLFRRKARSFLTMVAVAIGVAAMVALGALGAGLASGYQAIASGSQADFVLSQPDALDLTMSAVDDRVGDELRAMPEVRAVAGTIMGNVAAPGGASYFFLFGHDPQGFASEHFRIIEGHDLTVTGIRGRPLLLGKRAADSFELGVGDTLPLTGGTFRVVGIFETGDAFEEGAAVIPLDDAQILLQKHRLVSAYYIKLKDTSLAERFQARIERRYPDLLLTTASEFGDKQQMADYFQAMGYFVSILAILVGGVGMTNTILMSVFERTREIGVMRAVGWRRWRVLRLILGESLILAFVGGLLGMLLGMGIVYSVRNVPTYGILQGEFSTGLFVQSMVTVLVLGLIGGLYPAWRASKLMPIEAMRYDGGSGANGRRSMVTAVPSMTFKNLFRRKTRTFLTLIGIGIGVGAVVAIGGIMESFASQITQMAGGSNAHIMAIESDVSDTAYSAINERVGARIAAHPDVAHVSGIVFWALTNVEEMPFFILFGYHPNEVGIRHFKIVEGETLTANHQVILGRATAEATNKNIGDTMLLGDSVYRVVGIFESGVGWEELGGVVTLRDAQVLAGKPHQVTMYAIELQDAQKMDEVLAWLDSSFPEIQASITAEFSENMPDMQTSQASIGGIAMLIAIIGGVVMTNTILMSVLERTREIGVLRAMGWRRRRVLFMILKESLLLSGLSALVGILFGIGLTWILSTVPTIGNFMEATFTPKLFAQAMMIALFLGAAGGLYPAWRATKLSPIEALRYE